MLLLSVPNNVLKRLGPLDCGSAHVLGLKSYQDSDFEEVNLQGGDFFHVFVTFLSFISTLSPRGFLYFC